MTYILNLDIQSNRHTYKQTVGLIFHIWTYSQTDIHINRQYDLHFTFGHTVKQTNISSQIKKQTGICKYFDTK